MNLMEFLSSHGDLISSGVRDEADVWDQFGVEIAPLVIASVGFTPTTQTEGIVHFLTQLAHARSVTEEVLRHASPVSYVFHADNCFACFESADEALVAGINVRDAINAAALPLTGDENYGVSMGIGFGTLLSAGAKDGFFGDEMNIASKLGEDLGSRDDIFLSEAAHAALRSENQDVFEQFHGQVSGADVTYYRLR